MSLDTPSHKAFPCPIDGCTKRFVKQESMLQHEITAHSSDVGEYTCNVVGCAKVYKSPKALKQHFSAAHVLAESSSAIGSKYYLCCCNRKFKCFEHLVQHHRDFDSHNRTNGQNESGPPIPLNSSYMCSCLRKFDEFSILQEHHEAEHQPTTSTIHRYPCSHETCKRSFHSPRALLSHMVDNHEHIWTMSNDINTDRALQRDTRSGSHESLASVSTLPFAGPSLAIEPSLSPISQHPHTQLSVNDSLLPFSAPAPPLPPPSPHGYEQPCNNIDSRNSNHTTMSGLHVNVTVNGSETPKSAITDMIRDILSSFKNIRPT